MCSQRGLPDRWGARAEPQRLRHVDRLLDRHRRPRRVAAAVRVSACGSGQRGRAPARGHAGHADRGRERAARSAGHDGHGRDSRVSRGGTMNTIIVGYDDTEPSKRALERGAQFAKTFSAKLIVTSVAPVTTPAGGRSLGTDPSDTPSEHQAELHTAHEYLAKEGLEAQYVEAVGHPAESIVAAAVDH